MRMRVLPLVLVSLFAVAADAQPPGDARATAIVAAARKALGGEERLAALQTIALKATYRRDAAAGAPAGAMMIISRGGSASASSQVTGDIEWDLALPDKFVKIDNGAGAMAVTRTEGFNGDRLILDVASNAPGAQIRFFGPGSPGSDAGKTASTLGRVRADLARYLLGMIAGTQPGFAVTYAYAGRAESSDGNADAIDVSGPGDFKARLYLDADSHLPLMVTYQAPEPRVSIRTIAAPKNAKDSKDSENAAEMAKQAAAAQAAAPLVEFRVFFTDFRDVHGVMLPHHFSRSAAGKPTEEWDVTSYSLNEPIKADRFKVS